MSDNEASGSDDATPSERAKRGPTKLPAIVHARSQGTRLEVDVDEYGAPIGDKARSFASFLGVQARRVSILYDDWREVPLHLKNIMWTDIHVSFSFSIKLFV